jgi:hypothetical protein
MTGLVSASYHILQDLTGGKECRENSFLLEGWRSGEVRITLLFGFPIGANETKKDLQSSAHVDRTSERLMKGKDRVLSWSKLTDPGPFPPWCDTSYLCGRDCDNTNSIAKSWLQNGPRFPTIDSGARLFLPPRQAGFPESVRLQCTYIQYITFHTPGSEILL